MKWFKWKWWRLAKGVGSGTNMADAVIDSDGTWKPIKNSYYYWLTKAPAKKVEAPVEVVPIKRPSIGVDVFKEICINNGNRPVKINYTNWRGETEERVISVTDIMYTKTVWHPLEQWCALAWCHKRDEERVFAICDIHTCEVVP